MFAFSVDQLPVLKTSEDTTYGLNCETEIVADIEPRHAEIKIAGGETTADQAFVC
jgi:hypothetical protein